MNFNDQKDFSEYPSNRVCAILGNTMDARSALDALLKTISEKDIDIFHGDETVRAHEQGEQGLAAKVAKFLRGYGDIENDEIKMYESAIRNGEYIFEVHVRSEEEKVIVGEILARHGAREVNYYGTWYIEAMHEA